MDPEDRFFERCLLRLGTLCPEGQVWRPYTMMVPFPCLSAERDSVSGLCAKYSLGTLIKTKASLKRKGFAFPRQSLSFWIKPVLNLSTPTLVKEVN